LETRSLSAAARFTLSTVVQGRRYRGQISELHTAPMAASSSTLPRLSLVVNA
jgi:hypothetical protein